MLALISYTANKKKKKRWLAKAERQSAKPDTQNIG